MTWGGTLALTKLSRRAPSTAIDYRFVILGSVLPDLIDKPLGLLILGDELNNGRIFAHSLVFVVLLLLAAWTWRLRVGSALVAVALGVVAHLVLDRMWMHMDTLLWPLLGWMPERQDVSGWPEQMLEQLFSDPYTYVSEVVGAVVVAALLASLVAGRRLRHFALSGRMGGGVQGLLGPSLGSRQERPQQLQRGERPAQREADQRP